MYGATFRALASLDCVAFAARPCFTAAAYSAAVARDLALDGLYLEVVVVLDLWVG